MTLLDKRLKKLSENFESEKRKLEIEIAVLGQLAIEPRFVFVQLKPYDGVPVHVEYGDYNKPFNPGEIAQVLEGVEIPELYAIDYEHSYHAFVPQECFDKFKDITGEVRILPFRLCYRFNRIELDIWGRVAGYLSRFTFDLGLCFQFGRCTSVIGKRYPGGPEVYISKSYQVNHQDGGVLTVEGEPVGEIQPYRKYWSSPEESGHFEFWYCPYHEEGRYSAMQYINAFTSAIGKD